MVHPSRPAKWPRWRSTLCQPARPNVHLRLISMDVSWVSPENPGGLNMFKSWDDGRGFLLRWRSWIQWHCCFVKMKPWKPYGFYDGIFCSWIFPWEGGAKDFPVTEIPPLHQSIDSMSWPLGTMSATLLRSAKHQRKGNWKTWIQSTKMRICPYVNFQQSLQWKSLKFDENISQPGSLCGCRLPCHGRFGRFGRFGQCPQFWTHDLYTWIGHDGPRAN